MKDALDKEWGLFEKYYGHAQNQPAYREGLAFNKNFGSADYSRHAELSNNALLPKTLSLYLHVPDNVANMDKYIECLAKEISMRAGYFIDERLLSDIVLTGGGCSQLSAQQIDTLFDAIATQFHLDMPSNTNISIAMDLASCEPQDVQRLAHTGISQLVVTIPPSIGQQVSANEASAMACLELAMSEVDTLSIELWPHAFPDLQEYVSVMEKLVAIGVHNISAYNWWPSEHRGSESNGATTQPNTCLGRKIKIMRIADNVLLDAGYRHLGMDHYTLLNDEVSERILQLTTQDDDAWCQARNSTDIIGVGLGAFSKFETAFISNTTNLNNYRSQIEQDALPIDRGAVLSDRARLCIALTRQILCHTEVDLTHSTGRYIDSQGITNLAEYFANETEALKQLASENLVRESAKGFVITELGRYFLAQIAAVFWGSPAMVSGNVIPLSQDKYNKDR